ncbi:MAG: hypothetical protein HRU14_02000 [Planctomycetes bacterium]|nr:hypothetical protein [Planctomycetota bacterium]
MPKIVRCPNCISLIYEGAQACHHCGEKLNLARQRLFSRGAGLFILFAVIVFAIGDAVHLTKERSKTIRFDRNHIKRFIDGQLNGDDSRERWYRCKNGSEELASLRDKFQARVGENPRIVHREPRLVERTHEIVHWDRYPREIETRRYVHYIDWRDDGSGSNQSLPLTIEITGRPHSLSIIKVTWDGKDAGTSADGG